MPLLIIFLSLSPYPGQDCALLRPLARSGGFRQHARILLGRGQKQATPFSGCFQLTCKVRSPTASRIASSRG